MKYNLSDRHAVVVERLLAVSIAGLLFTAPFPVRFNNVFFVSCLVFGILTITNSYPFTRKQWTWLISCCAFFFWQIVGITYSEDKGAGIDYMVRNAFVVLFSFICFNWDKGAGFTKYQFGLQLSFIGGVILACIISHVQLFFAIKRTTGDWRSIGNYQFTYTGLSKFLDFHPSYFSIYILCALCFLLFDKRINGFFVGKYLPIKVFSILYLILFIFQLATRVGVVVLVEIFCLYIAYIYINEKRRWLSWVIIMTSVLFAVCSFFTVPTVKNRFNKLESLLSDSASFQMMGDARVVEWGCALEGVHKGMIIAGYGTGDVMGQMLACYKTKGYEKHIIEELNPHNQYLSIILGNGVIGLVLFGFVLFYPLFNKPRNFFLCLAIILALTTFAMTESFLVVRKGGFLWGFMIPLLWHNTVTPHTLKSEYT